MFSRRDKAGLQSHSGAIIADVDHLRSKGINPAELRDKLAKDPHVVMACISPSGDGVKALVRVFPDADLHEAHFHQAAEYFRKTYGVEMDPSGKDVCRACFATYDPGLKVNINARVMEFQAATAAAQTSAQARREWTTAKNHTMGGPSAPRRLSLPSIADAPGMMPEPLGEWIADVAYRVRCPIDFAAAAAVVMTGAVCAATCPHTPGTSCHLGNCAQPVGWRRRASRVQENPCNLRDL